MTYDMQKLLERHKSQLSKSADGQSWRVCHVPATKKKCCEKKHHAWGRGGRASRDQIDPRRADVEDLKKLYTYTTSNIYVYIFFFIHLPENEREPTLKRDHVEKREMNHLPTIKFRGTLYILFSGGGKIYDLGNFTTENGPFCQVFLMFFVVQERKSTLRQTSFFFVS